MEGENGSLGNERPNRFRDVAMPVSESPTVREQLMTGALRQGPSFVVLILILYGLWQMAEYLITEGVGKGIEQIKQGYREIQQSHDKNLREVLSTFEREQQRDSSVVGLLREVVENREILRDTHSLLIEMREDRVKSGTNKEMP